MSSDAYFQERRKKEIFALVVALVLLVGGISISIFADALSQFTVLSVDFIGNGGMGLNVIGFLLMGRWIMDGKDYVFPVKLNK